MINSKYCFIKLIIQSINYINTFYSHQVLLTKSDWHQMALSVIFTKDPCTYPIQCFIFKSCSIIPAMEETKILKKITLAHSSIVHLKIIFSKFFRKKMFQKKVIFWKNAIFENYEKFSKNSPKYSANFKI